MADTLVNDKIQLIVSFVKIKNVSKVIFGYKKIKYQR